MKKKTKIILGVAGAGVVAFIGLRMLRKRAAHKLGAGKSIAASSDAPLFPLSKGSGMGDKSYQKEYVKTLQANLNKVAPSPMQRLTVDGVFGDKTEAMLVAVSGGKQVSEELYNKLQKGIF